MQHPGRHLVHLGDAGRQAPRGGTLAEFGQPALQPDQVDLQPGQVLGEHIVDFPGQKGALLLPHHQQPGREGAQLFLGDAEFQPDSLPLRAALLRGGRPNRILRLPLSPGFQAKEGRS
jgi:hypothetical protein